MSTKKRAAIIGGVCVGVVLFTGLFIYINNTFFSRQDVPSINEGSIIAENWLRNFSSSYPYNGKNLELIEKEEVGRGEYKFVFHFLTEDPEYGVHNNKTIITTRNTEVVEAITNGIFDELAKKYVEKEETVNIYFVTQGEGEEEEEEFVVSPIERVISAAVIDDMNRVLVEELLAGPTAYEEEKGYRTLIERETSLISLNIEDEVAYIELSIGLNQQNDIGKEQIIQTVRQIEGVSVVRPPERRQVTVIEVEGIPEDFLFTRELQEGASGVDVKYLQIILNADPDTMVAQEGPGSPGAEVENFGESTTRAVMAFQRKYSEEVLRPAGLILSTGVVDEYTRDKLNAILEENRW
jgi:hypothetical protein